MEQGNTIIRADPEASVQKPAYVEYFDSMNSLFGAIPPDDRGYQNILVYDGKSDQPVLKLLRLVLNYTDGARGYQDEVEVMDKSKLPEDLRNSRSQLNFEVDAGGNLTKYPTSPQLSNYMQVAVSEASACSTKAGARILVNMGIRYISDGTKWNIPQPNKSQPALPKPSQMLPNG